MLVETNTKTWNDMKVLLDATIRELQKWRDYEEEVSYDPEFAEMLTDAIDANLPLMPCVIPASHKTFS